MYHIFVTIKELVSGENWYVVLKTTEETLGIIVLHGTGIWCLSFLWIFFFSWIPCWVNFILFSCGLLAHAYWTFKLYFPLLWTWGALWNGVPAPSEQGNQLRQVCFTAHTARKMQNQDKDSVIFFPCWFLEEYLKLACLCRNQQP